MKVVDALQTTDDDDDDDGQNFEITDRQTFIIFVWLVFIYGPFGSMTLFLEVAKKWEHKFKPKVIKNCYEGA